jgi:uncharacterized protein (TIGR02246 family)
MGGCFEPETGATTMKRSVSALLGMAIAAGGLCGAGDSQESGRDGGRPGPAGVSPAAGRPEDERAIRHSVDAFGQAFARGDARTIAGLFTEEGEAIDPEGATIKGRAAIEEHFAQRLGGSTGDRLETNVETVSFLAPGVARVAGRTQLRPSDGSTALGGRFTSIYVQRDGRWLLAVAREIPDKDLTPHEHLLELEWLVGDWVEESEDAVVNTSVAWTDGGNFLLRSFDVRVTGKPALTGTQRIGWDPLTRQIKSWVFDGNGGHGEGLWMRQGDQWVIKATGVRPDGRVATATQVLTFVNKDTLRWKSIDRTLGGEISQDIDEVVMVRKPPQPSAK